MLMSSHYTEKYVATQELFRKLKLWRWFCNGSVSITYNNCTDLVIVPQNLNAAQYIENILKNPIVPTVIKTKKFLRMNEIEVKDWPAVSPDLNPTE